MVETTEQQGTTFRGIRPLRTGVILKGFGKFSGLEINSNDGSRGSSGLGLTNFIVVAYGESVHGLKVGDIVELVANTQLAGIKKLNDNNPNSYVAVQKNIYDEVAKLNREVKLANNKTEANGKISKINMTAYYIEQYAYTEGHNIWSAYTPESDTELDKLLPALDKALEGLR